MVDWKSTAIRRNVKTTRCTAITHATDIETALAVIRKGSIQARPEREKGNALLDKPIEVVWLSPNDWSRTGGNEYGCIAFDFDWTELKEEYGEYIYGLEVLEDTKRPTSRILFSNRCLRHYFGTPYDPTTEDGGPWRMHHRRHYIKDGCVLQIAVAQSIRLRDLQGVQFIKQKQGKAGRKISENDAAWQFLARAASEPLPRIAGLTDKQLLFAWGELWWNVWADRREYHHGQGDITSTDVAAETLARSFLDRYGRFHQAPWQQKILANDAKQIASLFRSPKDLLLSIRKVVARWAKIEGCKSLDDKDWPPWANPGI